MGLFESSPAARVRGYLLKHSCVGMLFGSPSVLQTKNSRCPYAEIQREFIG